MEEILFQRFGSISQTSKQRCLLSHYIGNAAKRAVAGKSSANFIDDQKDDGVSGEFDGYNFPHSEEMTNVSCRTVIC